MFSVFLSLLVLTPAVADLAVAGDALSLLQNFLGSKLTRTSPVSSEAAGGEAEASYLAALGGSRASIANASTRTNSNIWIGVVSSAHNFHRRYTIRNTWMHFIEELNGGVQVKFVLCDEGYTSGLRSQLIQEYEQYGDMVVLDCPEGYAKGLLTKKVHAAMMYFLGQVDDHFDTFMKADDDAFVFLPELLTTVRRNTAPFLYIGQMLESEQPFRDPKHKWYEPVENWPGIWPRAASGAGYLLDRALLSHMLVDDWQHIKRLFLYNEDKAIGTWVKFEVEERGRNVEYVDLPGRDGIPKTDKPLVIYHHIGDRAMQCLWQKVALHHAAVDTCRAG
jgi:beta-1,3-galactosyltransferase 1